MADELEHAFRRASADDAVGAIVVTGAGRAFCAGMDLSTSGNVFGLDESLRPTLEDMHDKLDDPAILRGVRDTGGRVVLAIYACMKPVIGAINGAAVGIGATMTLPMDVRLAADGAQDRLRVRPARHRARRRARAGSCRGSSGFSQALEWVYAAEHSTPLKAFARGCSRPPCRPTSCWMRRTSWRTGSSTIARRSRSRWRGR